MPNGSETSSNYRLCQFSAMGNGIIEVVFVSSSIAAIDQFFMQLDMLFNPPQNKLILLLVNITKAPTLPTIYLIQQAKVFANRRPIGPTFKIAMITRSEGGLLVRETKRLLHSLQIEQDHIAFFGERQQSDAIRWLLESNQPVS